MKNRTLWALLAWTPEYGAATTVVAVLGIDTDPDRAGEHVVDHVVDHAVEWVPQQYQSCLVWRDRLNETPAAKLLAELEVWQLNLTNPAVPIDVPTADTDLALRDVVRGQLDDVLAHGLAG